MIVAATIGGTVSKIGGGNFGNGAITAAFVYAFNSGMHSDALEEFYQAREQRLAGLSDTQREQLLPELMKLQRNLANASIDQFRALAESVELGRGDAPDVVLMADQAHLYRDVSVVTDAVQRPHAYSQSAQSNRDTLAGFATAGAGGSIRGTLGKIVTSGLDAIKSWLGIGQSIQQQMAVQPVYIKFHDLRHIDVGFGEK